MADIDEKTLNEFEHSQYSSMVRLYRGYKRLSASECEYCKQQRQKIAAFLLSRLSLIKLYQQNR